MTTHHGWHGLIERYTSNDSSRLLLAIPSGAIGVYSLIWSVATFMTSGLWLPFALLILGVSLGAIVLSIMMMWTIFLSFTSRVESTNAHTQVDTVPSLGESRDDSIAIVKRQYAAGHISEAEFEQRVENLLTADAKSNAESGVINHRTREDIRETN
jgi:uncharacterized membrane protein